MPVPQPKPPEVIQAQVAAYGEFVGQTDTVAAKEIHQNIAALATGQEVSFLDETAYFYDVKGGLDSALRSDYEHDRYVGFLKALAKSEGMPPSQAEAIKGRSELLKNYAEFAPNILSAADKQEPIVNKEGSTSRAHTIWHEGKEYVVRVKHLDTAALDSEYIQGGLKAKGIKGLEQMVAVSYEDGVTIAEKMPGKEVNALNLEELEFVTEKQLEEAILTLKAAAERGIAFDFSPGNVFYDKDAGFGFIDLQTETFESTDKRLMVLLHKFGFSLDHLAIDNRYIDGSRKPMQVLDHKFMAACTKVLGQEKAIREGFVEYEKTT